MDEKQIARKLISSIEHAQRCMKLQIDEMSVVSEKLETLQTFVGALAYVGFADADAHQKHQKELIAMAIAQLGMSLNSAGVRVSDTHVAYIDLNAHIKEIIKHLKP